MIFQPPSGPSNPWDLGEYRFGDTLLWITGIVAIVFALLLLVAYFNNRKTHYLLWAVGFAFMWIIMHQVLHTGTFGTLFDPIPLAIATITPGALAAGLFYLVLKERKFIKGKGNLFGNIYILFVLVMIIAVAYAAFEVEFSLGDVSVAVPPAPPPPADYQMASDYPELAYLPSILAMVSYIPSGLALIILPIWSTFKTKETSWKALFLVIGGIFMCVAGALLAAAVFMGPPWNLVYNPDLQRDGSYTWLEWPGTAADGFVGYALIHFPVALTLSSLCFAMGILLPKKWNFEIPGIKFEEAAR